MKKLLTIVVNSADCGNQTPCDGVELICAAESLPAAVKQAKGKYIIIENRTFSFVDLQPFTEELENASQDIIKFCGGYAFKSQLFKGVGDTGGDVFAFTAYAALNAKSAVAVTFTPFDFSAYSSDFDAEEKGLSEVCGEFRRVKAKLSKEVYSFIFDLICERLLIFYANALIAVREGTVSADRLSAFDKKLKEEIVLYLALEKRFGNGKLGKIRKKGFKISGFTAKRYKKLLKNS